MLNKITKIKVWERIKENKIVIALIFILLIGAYLRISDFGDLARFNADQVRDAKIVDQMASSESFPLIGPKAGGTTFKLGPAFYYLQFISGSFFGFTPSGIALFIPLLSVASIFLFFLLMRRIYSVNIALVLTFLYSTSFYAIKYSRFAWNPNVIPFFIFAFFLLADQIIKQKTKIYHHLLFALTIGIGMQLHTTLLILFPILAIVTYIISYTKNKRISLNSLLLSVFLVIIINLPFFYYDVTNNGKNIKSFFEGINTKTENSQSIFEKIAANVVFFAQGNTYVILGYEPEKNWANPIKVIKSKSPTEIFSMLFGISVLFLGIFFAFHRLKKEIKKEHLDTIILLLSFSFLSFLLFLPISSELNVRFFIILIFLPYFFLGLIIEKISSLENKKLLTLIIFIISASFALINIKKIEETYNLDNYTAKESAYGGISVMEANQLSKWMIEESKEYPESKPYLMRFEFERSVEYFNTKSNYSTHQYKDNDLENKSIVFFIANKEKVSESIEELSQRFSVLENKSVGRFVFLSLLPKNTEHKIGFITDMHGKLSKKHSYQLEPLAKATMNNFISQMNNGFQPDFAIQGGDLIDGTDRRGQKSIDDFQYFNQLFLNLKMPIYHVIGNHELRGVTTPEWLQLTKNQSPYYSFEHDDLEVIVLYGNDTPDAEDNSNYVISKEQFNWIEKTLSSNKLRKIVFVHYPVLSKNIQPGDKTLIIENRERLIKLFSQYGVLAVFSGHIEKLEMNEEGGVRYFVIPGFEKSKNKSVPWYDSFAEITVKNEVEVDFYYKKDRAQQVYQKLKIPSQEFSNIEK